MRTVFSLQGRFVHKTRMNVRAPIHTRIELLTLRENISIDEVCREGHKGLEHMADVLAVNHTKASPTEKIWLDDWQLIQHKVPDEVSPKELVILKILRDHEIKVQDENSSNSAIQA